MIRWYDYLIAVIAAQFLYSNVILMIFGSISMGIFGAIGAYCVWSLWDNTYIPFRVMQEENK